MQSPSSRIINRISREKGFAKFEEAPPDTQFEVYKLTLEQIGSLLRKDPQTFPKGSLHEITTALNEIDVGFQYLLTQAIKQEHADDIRAIQRKIINAYSYLVDAYSRLPTRTGKRRPRPYYTSFLNGRSLISEINQFLEVEESEEKTEEEEFEEETEKEES
jgi:hypothetical protein